MCIPLSHKSGIERHTVDYEVTGCSSVFYLQHFLVYYLSSRVQQFDIQSVADSGKGVPVGVDNVGIEIDIVAIIIACVVKMQVYFLLR